ncbi:hypothetical protein C7M84_022336 [Penaeus vannamei]|uniref:Uncharacterized protein n=1 Tax=Penaeus vannamei TaxID=6689 RepID=A0A3R7PF04_PENVA|nr:hypothetical protein C7M84_022336 [Penaeus vannamei]
MSTFSQILSPFSPHRTYLVVAPRLVRAGQVYRLVVNILEPSPSLVVRATIFRDNIELAAVEHECESDAPQVLELMVPPGSSGGKYRLRLEGNELGDSRARPSPTRRSCPSLPRARRCW